jgi:hypothetical protein
MIRTEFFKIREDGVELKRTYSDAGVMILNGDGEMYEEAIDIADNETAYVESQIPIADELTDSEALKIILGRESDEAANGV